MVGARVPISVSTLSVIDFLPLPTPLKGLPLVAEGYESGSRSCLTDYPVVTALEIGSISLTRSTGIGSTNWLAAIDI